MQASQQAAKVRKLYGAVTKCGYSILCDGEPLYTAGNSHFDSVTVLDPEDAAAESLATLEAFCDQTGREIAQEMGAEYTGHKIEEDED